MASLCTRTMISLVFSLQKTTRISVQLGAASYGYVYIVMHCSHNLNIDFERLAMYDWSIRSSVWSGVSVLSRQSKSQTTGSDFTLEL